jgi:hypothetical protein
MVARLPAPLLRKRFRTAFAAAAADLVKLGPHGAIQQVLS